MELGNFLFGNSRGKYQLERGKWQNEFSRIFEWSKTGPYDSFENEVFKITPYYWGLCSCGTDDAIDQFCKEYKHADDCFLMKVEAYEKSLKESGTVVPHSHEWFESIEQFLETNGKEDCDCGFEEKFNKFVEEHPHTVECKLDKPNFIYKPTGYIISWYKYPLRDSYANKKLSFKQFSVMIDACIQSLKKPRKKKEKKNVA